MRMHLSMCIIIQVFFLNYCFLEDVSNKYVLVSHFFINIISLLGIFFQHKFTTLLNKVLSNSLHQSCKYFYKTLVNIWNLFIIILIYISTTVLLGHKHSFFIVAGNFYGIFKKTSTEFLHNSNGIFKKLTVVTIGTITKMTKNTNIIF